MLSLIKNILKELMYPHAHMKYFPLSNALQYFFFQKILRINADAKWPVHWSSVVGPVENVIINSEKGKISQPWPGVGPGNYIQAINKIIIGKMVYIGPGVKIISADHNVNNFDQHDYCSPIIIEDYCWLGANSVILKGVVLGRHTVVGAGAVVTKSFPQGYCVLVGNPAKIIKFLSNEDLKSEIER